MTGGELASVSPIPQAIMHHIYLRFIQFLYFKNAEFCKIYLLFTDPFCKRLEQNIVQMYLFAVYFSILKANCQIFSNEEIFYYELPYNCGSGVKVKANVEPSETHLEVLSSKV